MIKNPHPYDSSLKALLEGHTAEIVTQLLPGITVGKELNSEILRPPLRADRLHEAFDGNNECILHMEFETEVKSEITARMLEYYGSLYRKHRKPIVPVVIFPFYSETALPETRLSLAVGDKTFVHFDYHILALWHFHAQPFLDKQAISVYPLLPTMQGATYHVLIKGLNGMKESYGDNKKLLAEQILLFWVLLQRSTMVLEEDKVKIDKELEMFDSLLEECNFVREKADKARAQGLEQGLEQGLAQGLEKVDEARAQGEAKGKIELAQELVVAIVQTRFPSLADKLQQKIPQIKELAYLCCMVRLLSAATDENAAQSLLMELIA